MLVRRTRAEVEVSRNYCTRLWLKFGQISHQSGTTLIRPVAQEALALALAYAQWEGECEMDRAAISAGC